ncbi:STM3941 family protein [Prevotella sp. kh1p2]|uniref:STM3941 family protein n=1 Tax=Prevotella sp. kh1p2 TaxID=1761883 RepID=UPI0008C497D3|nr:STM3941 family protein [Prevotella sp. kh1p2]SET17884.1 hypothetical protein SAMN04487825_11859 [Prevotella sp. kh1p2]SNU12020.1 hypothetical protein SAMN06298210_1174 [Prevotellaceae bacterium KH2P17]
METIKVYHSLWKSGLLIAVSLGFAALGIYIIFSGNDGIVAWLSTLFFGIGGLFVLWLVLKERINHTPYYVITDNGIIMNSGLKTYEVHFADVEYFFVTEVGTARGKTKLIGIQYKRNVELQKFEDAGKAGHTVRHLNMSVTGSQEALPADGLTIKPKDLCEILNERVESSRNI